MLVAVAAGLDEGRLRGPEAIQAYFHHVYRVLESAAKDPNHDMMWTFPILGIPDPDAPQPETGWAAPEQSALAAYHKERHTMETTEDLRIKENVRFEDRCFLTHQGSGD